jgi:hypothetical protein
MKSCIFWDITPCSPLEANGRFGGSYRLQLQGRKLSQTIHQHEEGSRLYFPFPHTCFSLILFLDPEDDTDNWLYLLPASLWFLN